MFLVEFTTMHAVIVSGGKQYRVQKGQVLKLEKLEVVAGDTVSFDKILMLSDGENVQIGAPYLLGCSVTADVISQGRADKIRIIKMKRRKHHMKRMGHRQYYTEVKITDIKAA
jgi:large subunit ribosomal protein L21